VVSRAQGGEPVLRDATVFRWTTFGLAIESKVHEYVLNQRPGWYGYVPGAKPSFYHSWYLEPEGTMSPCRNGGGRRWKGCLGPSQE
jgi:hypothetical protein